MSKYNFGTKTAKEKFDDLLKEFDEFIKDETNTSKATNIATNSWHLIDWIFEENKDEYNNIGEIRENLYPKCDSLKIMHDIANGSKHNNVSRPKAKIKKTELHRGDYSSDYSRKDYNISKLIIELETGETLDFYIEIKKVINFWKEYFKN
jgi:hypothetical protein